MYLADALKIIKRETGHRCSDDLWDGHGYYCGDRCVPDDDETLAIQLSIDSPSPETLGINCIQKELLKSSWKFPLLTGLSACMIPGSNINLLWTILRRTFFRPVENRFIRMAKPNSFR